MSLAGGMVDRGLGGSSLLLLGRREWREGEEGKRREGGEREKRVYNRNSFATKLTPMGNLPTWARCKQDTLFMLLPLTV